MSSEMMDPSYPPTAGRRRSNTVGAYPTQYVPARHSMDDGGTFAGTLIRSRQLGGEEELYNYVAVACCLVLSPNRGYLLFLTKLGVC